MHPFRSIPPVSAAPDGLFERGHLWLQEHVVGGPFRFQLLESGRLRVGDEEQTYDPEDVPPQYRHAVRHVRARCDWGGLRAAVEDVESVVFFGVATQYRGVDYDWARLPSFLGTDIWSGTKETFLGVDTVEHIFDRLGLNPVNAVAKEVRATDFDPEAYEFPPSNWYDGPAAGVIVRNKRGACARIENPAVTVTTADAVDLASPEELAGQFVTPDRIQRLTRELEALGHPVTFDAVYERVLDSIFRESPPERFTGDADDLRAFRSVVAERTQRLL